MGGPMSASEKKWENQPGLFDYAKSRWNDPDTSREAARSIDPESLSMMQERIVVCFKFHGPEMSDEKLVELYHGHWDEGTDQGIRSRRGELVRKGRVFDTGKRTVTKYGRSAVVWRLVS
jgi:hypothetical protein